MPRLIWVFAGRTCHLLVLSWGGTIVLKKKKIEQTFITSFTDKAKKKKLLIKSFQELINQKKQEFVKSPQFWKKKESKEQNKRKQEKKEIAM